MSHSHTRGGRLTQDLLHRHHHTPDRALAYAEPTSEAVTVSRAQHTKGTAAGTPPRAPRDGAAMALQLSLGDSALLLLGAQHWDAVSGRAQACGHPAGHRTAAHSSGAHTQPPRCGEEEPPSPSRPRARPAHTGAPQQSGAQARAHLQLLGPLGRLEPYDHVADGLAVAPHGVLCLTRGELRDLTFVYLLGLLYPKPWER